MGFVVAVVTRGAYFASDFFQGYIVHRVGVGLSEDFSSAPVLLSPLDLPCVLPHENR